MRTNFLDFDKFLERLTHFVPRSGVSRSDMILQLDRDVIQQRMPQSSHTAIMIIGGAEDKVHGRQILQTFFQRSGGADAQLAIIPSASREPAAIGSRYQTIFEEMGAKSIQVIDIREREQGDRLDWLQWVEQCTGVFMTGGDQLRLCGLLADTPIMETVRKRAQVGQITLAGTSAGAAVMGQEMIAGGGSGESPNRALVDLTTGLGIIPEIIVDQHFHNRNRMARLMSAIAHHPEKIGIGIDEDTCAMFLDDGTFQVIGRGTVTIVDPGEVSYTSHTHDSMTDPISIHNLRVHILSNGERYDLYHRKILVSHN